MEKISTRVAYGEALAEIGENTDIIVLDADLSSCTMSEIFAEKYPERFFNVGIAEANMIGIAAGFATTGKTVFCHSFAMFTAGRCYDQIRNSLAYPNLNVKVVGSHAGLTVGEDGATHQCIEDMSLMRTIPNMVVVSPCDANEAKKAVRAIAQYQGPCYMRTGRLGVPQLTQQVKNYTFTLGKGSVLVDGSDLTIIATGLMVQKAYQLAQKLRDDIKIRVIDMHTIKPIDRELIIKAAKETGAIVTAEEHNVIGGLGSAVSEVVSEEHPVPVLKVGVQDSFGRSGPAEELLDLYGLSEKNLAEKCKQILKMKQTI